MTTQRSRSTRFLVTLAFFFAQGSVAMEGTQQAVVKAHSVSWGPILSYTPTYGALFGGSIFQKANLKPGLDFGLAFITSLKPNFMIENTFKYHAREKLSYVFEGNFSSFFTSYYGEGARTKPSDRIDLANASVWIKTGPELFLSQRWSVWPHLLYRMRDEKSNEALLADKTSVGGGVALKYAEDPTGSPFWQQHQLSLRAVQGGFQQAELDLRAFWSLAPGVVFASRALGQFSLGNPDHLYRYSLGGTQLLRGYFENRFRGKHTVVAQEEVRFAIWKLISGAVFVDAGSITDTIFETLKWSYGVGLRFGLPPDNVAKVRLDIGFSQDQAGVFFMYGEAF